MQNTSKNKQGNGQYNREQKNHNEWWDIFDMFGRSIDKLSVSLNQWGIDFKNSPLLTIKSTIQLFVRYLFTFNWRIWRWDSFVLGYFLLPWVMLLLANLAITLLKDFIPEWFILVPLLLLYAWGNWSIAVRRFHDLGMSNGYALLLLIPFVNLYWLFILLSRKWVDGLVEDSTVSQSEAEFLNSKTSLGKSKRERLLDEIANHTK